MSERKAFLRRLSGFAGLPLLSLLAPFLLLPIIARLGGVGGWAALAIGQSLGAFAAIAVTFGWTLIGPARVAGATESVQKLHYGDSVVSRIMILFTLLPVLCIATFVLAPSGYRIEAIVMAAALAVGSLSPAWYAIGIGKPSWIAKYDVLPRLIAVAVSAGLLLWTGQILLYPLCLIAATVLGSSIFSFRIGKIHQRRRLEIKRVAVQMWQDRTGALTVIAAGAYSATPVAILSLVAPAMAVAVFASADKLYKVSLYSVQTLGSSFQGWVAEDSPNRISRRMRISVYSHTGLGIVGFLAIASLGSPATKFLFGESVAADQLTAFFYGLAFLAVSVNTSTGRHILVPLGRVKMVLFSTTVGAIVGVICMVILGSAFGGAGGAAGLAAGELSVCLVQIIALIRARRY